MIYGVLLIQRINRYPVAKGNDGFCRFAQPGQILFAVPGQQNLIHSGEYLKK